MKKKISDVELQLLKNIRKAMNSKGWNQSRLSQESDVSEKALSKIISGEQRLTLVYLHKIAMALSLREIDLFTFPDIYVKADGKDSGPAEVLLQLRLTKEKKDQVLKLVFGENNIEILNK